VGLRLKRAISLGESVAANDKDLGLKSLREVEKLAECDTDVGRLSVFAKSLGGSSSFSYPGLVGQSGSSGLPTGLEWTESTLESESCHSRLNDGRPWGTLGVAGLPNTKARGVRNQ
jgi:hypothetical protein